MATVTEETIRVIALAAIEELSGRATPELVRKIVDDVVRRLERDGANKGPTKAGNVFITIYGHHHPDIIPDLTTVLNQSGCLIQDLSHRVLHELFTMIVLADMTNSTVTLNELRQRLAEVAWKFSVRILVQSADMFK